MWAISISCTSTYTSLMTESMLSTYFKLCIWNHVLLNSSYVHAKCIYLLQVACLIYIIYGRYSFVLIFQICCQFDFKRLPGSKVTCPWKIKPQPITDSNIHDRYTLMHITTGHLHVHVHVRTCSTIIIWLEYY